MRSAISPQHTNEIAKMRSWRYRARHPPLTMIAVSAVSMWYSYISIDIDRHFTKYLDIDRYRYTRHCSWTEWCEDPVQHLPIPLPAINRLQKSVYFCLKCFSLTVNTNLLYGKQQKTLIS